MNFIISANTDIGLTKDTNQDSLSVKVINTSQGRMAFAILCDGMGGLAKGEVASASVIKAFDNWICNELPKLCQGPIEDSIIRKQWEKIVTEQNEIIKTYGAKQGVKLGTTVVAMLLTQNRYYILNVGDSRAYELTTEIKQITQDQTFVAREVSLGNMTEEEAMKDSRRSVLLQCVGASDSVYPDFFFGDVQGNAVYMLCCDGFRHEIMPEEIYEKLQPNVLMDDYQMSQNSIYLIELNKQRKERDNISVALIRTF
ncbi:MAG: serine/threonine-protein phosphatase [Tyzzerella sp.]|nr:serine/threonine-protein phosphatase [Tyzzerella sp.]